MEANDRDRIALALRVDNDQDFAVAVKDASAHYTTTFGDVAELIRISENPRARVYPGGARFGRVRVVDVYGTPVVRRVRDW